MTRINITDDMIERAHGVLSRFTDMVGDNHGIIQKALEAALDQRTGPKDRRVEQDDTCGWSRRMSNFGQRDDDKCWVDLPRKSDRLKREAEEARAGAAPNYVHSRSTDWGDLGYSHYRKEDADRQRNFRGRQGGLFRNHRRKDDP